MLDLILVNLALAHGLEILLLMHLSLWLSQLCFDQYAFLETIFGLTDNSIVQWALDLAKKNPLGSINTGIDGATPLPNLPFMNGGGIIFNLAIGYVILSLTPKVADMIRMLSRYRHLSMEGAFGEALVGAGLIPRAIIGGKASQVEGELKQAQTNGNTPASTYIDLSVKKSVYDTLDKILSGK